MPRVLLTLVVFGSSLTLLASMGTTRASFSAATSVHSSLTLGTWVVTPPSSANLTLTACLKPGEGPAPNDGFLNARFGYVNTSGATISVLAGPDNKLTWAGTPGEPDNRWPITKLKKKTHKNAFDASLSPGGSVTWTLVLPGGAGTATATADANTRTCNASDNEDDSSGDSNGKKTDSVSNNVLRQPVGGPQQSSITSTLAPLTKTGSPTTSSVVACQPVSLTYTGATTKDGNTTYSYTLTGGGATASGCKNIVSVALPVCFNPALVGGGGLVIAESHPLTPTGWGYQPGGSGASWLAMWVAGGKLVGGGPVNAVFSLTLPGSGIPLAQTVATVRLAGTDPAHAAGTVVVPVLVGCSLPPATTGASGTNPDPTPSGN